MKIIISSGHGKYIRGAKGVLDEVDEARRVVERVAEYLRSVDVSVLTFHDDVSRTQSENLNRIVSYHNAQSRDRDVSVHFNAYKSTSAAVGTEVLYVSQAALATQLSAAIAAAGSLTNRGGKKRTDLAFLNRSAKPAVLIEVCFVDSTRDAALYRQNFDAICKAIAETIGGKAIGGEPQVPGVPEPPDELLPEVTGNNVVDVSFSVTGDALVLINGDEISGNSASGNKLELTMAHVGDVLVTVDGEDFQVKPPPATTRPTLRAGSRGDLVRLVQEVLGVQPIDGIFGANTQAAVKAFQRKYGLDADGVVGPATWAKLEQVYTLPPYEAPEWHEDIICTVFGGNKDPNNSAYSPFDKITDIELSVALPYKFTGVRPQVIVRNRANGREVACNIRDIGPYLLDDDYWNVGTRPLAETCWKQNSPLPRGPHKGKIPNGAGIDLTPAVAKALGISGKGQCDWRFT